jgi:NTP pyrophosphatase (non-canonical NTP hydrolase)
MRTMMGMPTPRTLNVSMVYDDVHKERERAHAKHGAKGHSREAAAWTDREWLPILMEEVGEVAHELTYDTVYVDARLALRKELVQVAAMACAWIDRIDAFKDDWAAAR